MMKARQQDQQRLLIAMEAARLMSESGIEDYRLAKRKAVQKLGLSEARNLPGNQEIRDALFEYQGLFKSDSQPAQLKLLRKTAIDSMLFFQSFQPRLVGDVLAGTANEHSRVELHLFVDYPEQVGIFLMDHNIPYKEKSRRVRYNNERHEMRPAYGLFADGVEVEVVVFAIEELRRAPNSLVDGRPMARGDLKAVEALLDERPGSS